MILSKRYNVESILCALQLFHFSILIQLQQLAPLKINGYKLLVLNHINSYVIKHTLIELFHLLKGRIITDLTEHRVAFNKRKDIQICGCYV